MDKLTSRERVRRALDHEEPDRVPVDLGGRNTNLHREEYEKLANSLGIAHTDCSWTRSTRS